LPPVLSLVNYTQLSHGDTQLFNDWNIGVCYLS
jgi:hypothetical protein